MFHPRFPLFDDDPAPGAGGDPPPAGDAPPAVDPPAAAPPAITLDALKDLLKAERTATLAEVTKQLNGLDAKYTKAAKKVEPPVSTSATLEQLREEERQELQEQITALQQEREAEKKESQKMKLDSMISSALSGMPWRVDNKGNTEGVEVAHLYYSTKAERDENGTLHMGGIPLAQLIKEDAPRRFKGFHTIREVGGSGATASKAAAGNPLDKLNKPNLSRDETREVQNHLADLFRQLQGG